MMSPVFFSGFAMLGAPPLALKTSKKHHDPDSLVLETGVLLRVLLEQSACQRSHKHYRLETFLSECFPATWYQTIAERNYKRFNLVIQYRFRTGTWERPGPH